MARSRKTTIIPRVYKEDNNNKMLWSQSIFKCRTQTLEQSARSSDRVWFKGHLKTLSVLRKFFVQTMQRKLFDFFFNQVNQHAVAGWTCPRPAKSSSSSSMFICLQAEARRWRCSGKDDSCPPSPTTKSTTTTLPPQSCKYPKKRSAMGGTGLKFES